MGNSQVYTSEHGNGVLARRVEAAWLRGMMSAENPVQASRIIHRNFVKTTSVSHSNGTHETSVKRILWTLWGAWNGRSFAWTENTTSSSANGRMIPTSSKPTLLATAVHLDKRSQCRSSCSESKEWTRRICISSSGIVRKLARHAVSSTCAVDSRPRRLLRERRRWEAWRPGSTRSSSPSLSRLAQGIHGEQTMR